MVYSISRNNLILRLPIMNCPIISKDADITSKLWMHAQIKLLQKLYFL